MQASDDGIVGPHASRWSSAASVQEVRSWPSRPSLSDQ